MQKGNDCNALQEDEKALSEVTEHKDFSDNRRLLMAAQGEGEEAEAATEALVLNNTGLVRSIALRFFIGLLIISCRFRKIRSFF